LDDKGLENQKETRTITGVANHVRDVGGSKEAVISKGVGILARDLWEADLGLGERHAQPAEGEDADDGLGCVLDTGLFGGGGEPNDKVAGFSPLGVEGGDRVGSTGGVDLAGEVGCWQGSFGSEGTSEPTFP